MKGTLAITFCTGVCLTGLGDVYAQDAALLQTSASSPIHKPVAETKEFTVTVRAIGASGPVPLSENMQSMPERPVELDERVEDLRSKLSRLPFTTFRLLSMEDENISLMSRRTIRLSNGHELCLRAMDRNNDSITMWLKWKDENGMAILDTRLNFALNESMVAGVEGQQDTGMILALSVSPKLDEAQP